MKIIQTFWTGNTKNILKKNFGWSGFEYNLYSWALSSHRLREYYDELILHTDELGKKLLIDDLNLPYTDFKVDLSFLEKFPPNVWALAKIHTYCQQSEPFLHIDGDVFIWEAFDKNLLGSKLITQNIENGGPSYVQQYRNLYSLLPYKNQVFKNPNSFSQDLLMYNTGLFGGSDIQTIQKYCNEVFELTKKNFTALNKIHATAFSLFFEQFYFYEFLDAQGIKASCYFTEIFNDPIYLGFGDFEDIPYSRKYLHLVSRFKTNKKCLDLLERQLRAEYPYVYLRIKDFLEEKRIKLINKYSPPSSLFRSVVDHSFLRQNTGLNTSTEKNAQKEIDQQILAKEIYTHGLYKEVYSIDRASSKKLIRDNQVELQIVKTHQTETDPDSYGIAIVPEIGGLKREVSLDKFDFLLLSQLNKPKNLNDLFISLCPHFEGLSENFENSLRLLIDNRTKNFLFNKLITTHN